MIDNWFPLVGELGSDQMVQVIEWALEVQAINQKLDYPLPLILTLSSSGGDICVSLDLAEFLLELQKEGQEVITVAAGMCLSAPLAPLVAGIKGKRYACPRVLFLFHKGNPPKSSDPKEEEVMARTWERQDRAFDDFIANYCSLTFQEIQQKSTDITAFGAEEALNWGLVDKIGWPPLDKFIVAQPPNENII